MNCTLPNLERLKIPNKMHKGSYRIISPPLGVTLDEQPACRTMQTVLHIDTLQPTNKIYTLPSWFVEKVKGFVASKVL